MNVMNVMNVMSVMSVMNVTRDNRSPIRLGNELKARKGDIFRLAA